ncbi:DNA polymerase epsilon subunit 2 [Hypsibius exemplaris]|uniref:DNA polymerase epsilon subunit n=1 Tax=Hypsibius exemplaris TaxID=2072580 RepID=A0A9X6RJF7_HYPEX|nr:DNA polymerase epsilon subunit 2 [Hypsibius exemplaris]
MSTVKKYFKLRGINIGSDALHYLESVVTDFTAGKKRTFIEEVASHLQKQSEISRNISRAEIEIAVKEFSLQDDVSGTEFFWVYDAFSIPQLFYDVEKKHYLHAATLNKPPPLLHETADFRNFAFVERYEALFQRMLRNPAFTRPSLDRTKGDGKFTLHLIEELLSSSIPIHNTVVLAMLSSLQEPGKYHLEDPTGAIQLEYNAETSFTGGLFTENIFILAEGWYDEKVFHATGLGMPPAETRSESDKLFGNFNFFGGSSQVALRVSPKLKKLEDKYEDSMFVIMADVWLDRPEVLEKLEAVFRGLADSPPFCFILCGDFISETENMNHAELLKTGLKSLQIILQRYPGIMQQSQLVFVPGPMDIGITGILPRPRLPKNLTKDFEATIAKAIFTTNPCRIQFCTREIVVMREDILTKMCRTLIKEPIPDGRESRFKNLTLNLAKTILSQGHLSPLPTHVLPVFWPYDHALRMPVLPDMVVVADMQEPFIERSSDCLVASPSSFPRHKYQFHVYWPSQNTIELSQI